MSIGLKKISILMVVSVMLFFSQLAMSDDEVAYILSDSSPPSGVVFEVLTHEKNSWLAVLSYIRKSAKRLHAKYPNLPIVIVSHGLEEFALLKSNKNVNAKTHNEIKSLLKNNIKLEVCGTFAGWNGYEGKDFPDYVTVVDQAPISIELYEQDGFTVIVIDEALLKEMGK